MREGAVEDEMRLLKKTWCGVVLLSAGLAVPSCVDSDDRCGSERELDATGVCICKAGTVDQGGTCVEVVEAPSGLGDACDESALCSDPLFPDCHAAEGEPGFCTKNDCTSSDECGKGYHCALDETPAYCRPPTGQGAPCDSDDDCKDFDATFCSIGNPAGVVCLVRDCVDDTSCSPGYGCFDLGMFMPGLPKVCTPQM
jgi:hypothetical protein